MSKIDEVRAETVTAMKNKDKTDAESKRTCRRFPCE